MKTIRVNYNYTNFSGRVFKILYFDKNEDLVVVMYENGELQKTYYNWFQDRLNDGQIKLNMKERTKQELVDVVSDASTGMPYIDGYQFQTKIGLVQIIPRNKTIELFNYVGSEYIDCKFDLDESELEVIYKMVKIK